MLFNFALGRQVSQGERMTPLATLELFTIVYIMGVCEMFDGEEVSRTWTI